jgi:glutamate synthase domain-containing protein 3
MTGGVVVVLGRTGRNFAAGMSGGIAYVLNEDGGFAGRCNLAMVGLEVVDGMPHDESTDAYELHRLLTMHRDHTGSKQAEKILEAFEDYQKLFVKVMPNDYRRVLEERAAKEAELEGVGR